MRQVFLEQSPEHCHAFASTEVILAFHSLLLDVSEVNDEHALERAADERVAQLLREGAL